jgi:hypothetical protein
MSDGIKSFTITVFEGREGEIKAALTPPGATFPRAPVEIVRHETKAALFRLIAHSFKEELGIDEGEEKAAEIFGRHNPYKE